MQNFAKIQTKMNIRMDDDWNQNGQKQTHMRLATKKNIQNQKRKMLFVF